MTVLQAVKNNMKVKPHTVFPGVRQIYSYKMVQEKKKKIYIYILLELNC